MLVVLDRGHGQKAPGAPFDPGCVSGALREVDLASAYIGHAEVRLRALGHRVEVIDSGTYDQRHARAIAWANGAGRALYVQCHVNAGGGAYALVEHDARSRAGSRAADLMTAALDTLPEVSTAKVHHLAPGERGWVCIDDIWAAPTMCGVIYEPGFIDAPAHATLWTPDGLERIGAVLAEGVHRYAQ